MNKNYDYEAEEMTNGALKALLEAITMLIAESKNTEEAAKKVKSISEKLDK